MTTFVFPTLTRGPQAAGIQAVANTAVNRSPLTGHVQVLQRPGSRMLLAVTFNRRGDPDRADLKGFLAKLFGQEHTIEYEDPTHVQRGALGGSPLVNGVDQTGESLIIDGASATITDWLKSGDHISYDNGTFKELKIVTGDVNTDGGGNATIPIFPEIHVSPPTNNAVDIAVPIVGTWRLAEAQGAAWEDEVGDRSTFVIEFEEHIE